MFFILALGRRQKKDEAPTIDQLGKKVMAMMSDRTYEDISVAVGKTDQAVMPYAWIRRDLETDEWRGELGDSIKLGIDDGLLVEYDPIQMMSLDAAIEAGLATVENYDTGPTVTIASDVVPKHKKSQKKSEDEYQAEAKRMVDDLFRSLKE